MDFGTDKCKKCGTLLVARNTNGLCDECHVHTVNDEC